MNQNNNLLNNQKTYEQDEEKKSQHAKSSSMKFQNQDLNLLTLFTPNKKGMLSSMRNSIQLTDLFSSIKQPQTTEHSTNNKCIFNRFIDS